jgi:glycine/D-amino acid oxidase-like deaminating enzyme
MALIATEVDIASAAAEHDEKTRRDDQRHDHATCPPHASTVAPDRRRSALANTLKRLGCGIRETGDRVYEIRIGESEWRPL